MACLALGAMAAAEEDVGDLVLGLAVDDDDVTDEELQRRLPV
jgi:hypothetical protein